MKTMGIGCMFHRSEPVRLTLVELARCGVDCTTAARLDGRTVVTQIMPGGWVDDVRESGFMDRPVTLGLRAVFEAARDRDLLRIDVAATATTAEQRAIAAELWAQWGEGPWLWSVPWKTLGLHLGTILLPAPPELLVKVVIGDDMKGRLEARDRALSPYFDWVLWGDPAEAVERVIAEGYEASDAAPDEAPGIALSARAKVERRSLPTAAPSGRAGVVRSHPGVQPPLPVVTPAALDFWAHVLRPVDHALRWVFGGVFFLTTSRFLAGHIERDGR